MKDSKKRLSSSELSRFIVYICVLIADVLMLPIICMSGIETFQKILILSIGIILVVLLVIRVSMFVKYIVKNDEGDSKE